MNAHDSEKLAGILHEKGYGRALDEKSAGLVVYNTCCIRENAENKVLGHLGHLKHIKRENPRLLVAVGGCMPQQEAALEKLTKTGVIDILFGTHNLHTFGDLLDKALSLRTPVVEIWDAHRGAEDAEEVKTLRESPFKGSINIMYGCDNFCSYCVVPMVRGRERSRRADVILEEAGGLVTDGAAEITLLGQNVNSYSSGGVNFPTLLKMLAEQKPRIPRIRFMTSHPKDLSAELIKTIKEHANIMNHVHLPVQSGSDSVLRAMNRGYTGGHYLSLVENLRNEIPDVSITTDIIVGFPSETEADFADTLALAERVRFNGAFTFLYSAREGTAAASMDCQVPEDAAKERFGRLLETINPIILEENKKFEGKALDVLVEKCDNGTYSGRAECSLPVHFAGGGFRRADLSALRKPPRTPSAGDIVPVEITEAKTFYLKGLC